MDMDEQLSFWVEGEVDVHSFRSFEPSESTSVHDYVSAKVIFCLISFFFYVNEILEKLIHRIFKIEYYIACNKISYPLSFLQRRWKLGIRACGICGEGYGYKKLKGWNSRS